MTPEPTIHWIARTGQAAIWDEHGLVGLWTPTRDGGGYITADTWRKEDDPIALLCEQHPIGHPAHPWDSVRRPDAALLPFLGGGYSTPGGYAGYLPMRTIP